MRRLAIFLITYVKNYILQLKRLIRESLDEEVELCCDSG